MSKLIHVQNAFVESEKGAKKLLVGAGARALFYPTLLYNVVRNKLEAEFHWWDQIEELLFLGAVPFPKDVLRLKDLGVEAVITLNESYETLVPSSVYQSQGIKQLVMPTRDYLFAPSLMDIQRGVQFIHENIQQGKATYVHCKAGRGRSTTVVLCYLIEHKGMTPCDAFHYVQSKRPRVLLAASQWQAVFQYTGWKNQIGTVSKNMLKPSWPKSTYMGNSDEERVEIANQDENSISFDDSAIFVINSDLDGYREVQDSGIKFSKEFWGAYSIRFMNPRSVIGVAQASAALAKLTYLWIALRTRNACLTPALSHNTALNSSLHCTTTLDLTDASVVSAVDEGMLGY